MFLYRTLRLLLIDFGLSCRSILLHCGRFHRAFHHLMLVLYIYGTISWKQLGKGGLLRTPVLLLTISCLVLKRRFWLSPVIIARPPLRRLTKPFLAQLSELLQVSAWRIRKHYSKASKFNVIPVLRKRRFRLSHIVLPLRWIRFYSAALLNSFKVWNRFLMHRTILRTLLMILPAVLRTN